MRQDKLKIIMAVRSFSEHGGLELYAHRTIEGLVERGHHVTVVCEESDSSFAHGNCEKEFFEKANCRLRKSDRIKHHYLAATKAVQRLKNLHGELYFDIVHSQHLPMQGADVVSFHNHTAARLIAVGQNWEQLLTKAKMIYSTAYKNRYRQDEILCRAPVLMFPANVMRDDFRQTYNLDRTHDLSSYVVAHPGASFPEKETRALTSDSTDTKLAATTPFTFLFVGKGYRKKGLDILLSACHKLKSQQIDFRLLIAGLRQKPIDRLRLKALGLSKDVHYLGFRKDMKTVFAQAKAVVLPSRIEPFGMAPVQGMLEGLVPIVSKVSGVAEVLSDGVNSLILQDHLSPFELSQLMQKLIEQPDLCQLMASQAKTCADQITWDKTVDATLNAYEIVMSRRSDWSTVRRPF